MSNPHAPSLAAQNERLSPRRTASGIWSLDGNRLVDIDDFGGETSERPVPQDRKIVLVRSEQVLMLAIPLPPLPSATRRRAALPFAIEDLIAEPLDRVHIALGSESALGVWLVGVVSHALMVQWLEQMAEAGLERARLVPDVMALPIPDVGSWSVDLAGNRAMIRTADGSGFAVPLALLDAAWRAAGEAACIAYGDPLPPQFAAVQSTFETELAARLLAPGIDLRQGIYAAPRRPFHPLWQQIALVAGLGALAHGAIAVADTIALAHLAQQRAAQVRQLGANLQPAVQIGPELGEAIVALTPDPATTGSNLFMSLLSRSAAALASGQSAVGPLLDGSAAGSLAAQGQSPAVFRSVSFDGQAGTLTIELETDNIADLQRIAQALTRAGLSAQPGSATTQAGKAVGSFVVRAV